MHLTLGEYLIQDGELNLNGVEIKFHNLLKLIRCSQQDHVYLSFLLHALHLCSHLGVVKANAAEFRVSMTGVLLSKTIRPNVSFYLQPANTKLSKPDSRQAHECRSACCRDGFPVIAHSGFLQQVQQPAAFCS